METKHACWLNNSARLMCSASVVVPAGSPRKRCGALTKPSKRSSDFRSPEPVLSGTNRVADQRCTVADVCGCSDACYRAGHELWRDGQQRVRQGWHAAQAAACWLSG
jgi:hypothetical protein